MTETIGNGGALASALAKAQAAMKSAKFNKQNPHFKNKYADLSSIIEATRKPLTDNGLSITQATEMNGHGFGLRTTLHHTSGETVSSFYPLPSNAKPQELGSALTYARRYSLSSLVCIAADEDDDAEAAKHLETGELVMPDQVAEIDKLIAACGDRSETVRKAALAKYGIKDFSNLYVSDYPALIKKLSATAKESQQ